LRSDFCGHVVQRLSSGLDEPDVSIYHFTAATTPEPLWNPAGMGCGVFPGVMTTAPRLGKVDPLMLF